MYKIIQTREFVRDLKKLDNSLRKEILKECEQLQSTPYIGKPLSYKFFREKRVKDHRFYLQYINILINEKSYEHASSSTGKFFSGKKLLPQHMLAIAEMFLNKGENNAGKRLFESFYKKHPDNTYFCFIMGLFSESLNNESKAAGYYKNCLRTNSGFINAINRLSYIYFNKNASLEDFKGLFSSVNSADPGIIDLKRRIIQESNSESRNRSDVARYFINDIIRIQQNDWTLYQMLAQIELMENNDEKAIEYSGKAIEIDSTQYYTYYLLGFALNRSGDIKEAVNALEKAVLLNPGAEDVFSILGDIYFSEEHNDKAIDRYQKVLRLNPDNHFVLNNLGYLFSKLGIRLDEALEMAKKAVAQEPDNKHYLDTLGWIYFMLKNYDEALVNIKKASDIDSGSAVIMDHLGDIYKVLNLPADARNAWEASLKMDSNNSKVKAKLGIE